VPKWEKSIPQNQHENLGGIKYPLKSRTLLEDINPLHLVQITIPRGI